MMRQPDRNGTRCFTGAPGNLTQARFTASHGKAPKTSNHYVRVLRGPEANSWPLFLSIIHFSNVITMRLVFYTTRSPAVSFASRAWHLREVGLQSDQPTVLRVGLGPDQQDRISIAAFLAQPVLGSDASQVLEDPTMTSSQPKAAGRRKRPDDAYLDRLAGISFRPIFIMGEYRSGTTVLYRLLNMTKAFNSVLAYHMARYDELLANHAAGRTEDAIAEVNREMEARGIVTRTLDAVRVDASSPLECWPVLLRKGTMRLSPRSQPAFDEMCRKIQFISDAMRPVLIKNPADLTHFMEVKALYPESKMIFIHRNPIHTMDSMLRAMRRAWFKGNAYTQMMSRSYARLQNNPLIRGTMQWLLDPDAQRMVITHQMVRRITRGANYYQKHIDGLDRSDYCVLRYEDLCADPNRTIGDILDFLGLEPEVQMDFAPLVEPREVVLLPEIARIETKLRERFATIMERNGYLEPQQ